MYPGDLNPDYQISEWSKQQLANNNNLPITTTCQ